MTESAGRERRLRREPPPEFLAPHTRKTDATPERRCVSWYCKRAVVLAAQAICAAALLAGGTIFTVRQQQLRWADPGKLLALPGLVINAERPSEQVRRVAAVLRLHTKDSVRADRIAAALVSEGGKNDIDPALLIGVLLTENSTLDPRARSNVGARGLMQVMPFNSGKFGCSTPDLVNIEGNICHGVAVLAHFMGRSNSNNVERALLRYNGCVRGTNTPRCHTYPNKVLRFSRQAALQMFGARLD